MIVVTGSPETLQQLDAALWNFQPTEFLPHCYLESDAGVVVASPVILATVIKAAPYQQVLLNLGDVVPDGFEEFKRVIEVVGLENADRQLARGRWKRYTDLGYAITRHDLHLKATH